MLELFGISLILIGILLLFWSGFRNADVKTEWAGVVMIGPFPIAVGSNKAITIFAVFVSLLLFLFFVFGFTMRGQ